MAKPFIVEAEITEDEKDKDGDKTEPRLPDDEGGDDDDDMEIDIDPERRPIYRPPTLDECRRAFVLQLFASYLSEYFNIDLCEQGTQWLKSGELPKKPKSHLKTVKD